MDQTTTLFRPILSEASLMAVTNLCNDNLFNLKVKFEKISQTALVVSKIKDIHNLQFISWYISPHGWHDNAAFFYSKHFIKKLPQAHFRLWDLTAWSAIKNPSKKGLFNSCSPLIEKINRFNQNEGKKIEVLKSSDFFSWIFGETNEKIKEYVKNTILSRLKLFKESESHSSMGFDLKSISPNTSHMLTSIEAMDCSKIYSVLQYLEAIYLISHIVENQHESIKEIQVAFVLPNDENKYYCEEEPKIFEDDLKTILLYKLGDKLNNVSLDVLFLPFEYRHPSNRPYLEGKVLKEISEVDLKKMFV